MFLGQAYGNCFTLRIWETDEITVVSEAFRPAYQKFKKYRVLIKNQQTNKRKLPLNLLFHLPDPYLTNSGTAGCNRMLHLPAAVVRFTSKRNTS